MEFTPMVILAQKGSRIYPNTNLPVTLWLKYDNEKIIYMQNNYNKYTKGDDLIPISIDKDNPKLLSDVKLNISDKDLKKVFNFIKKKYKSLIDMVDDVSMDYSIMEYTYINRFRQTVVDGFFVNGLYSRDYKDLPVNLYLYCNNIDYDDERDLYSFLMVNTYNKENCFEDCVTVSIDKDNPKLLYDVKLGISEEDFKKVQNFIKSNYGFLDKYINDENIDAYDLYCHLALKEDSGIDVGTTKDGYYIYVNVNDSDSYPHFHYVDSLTKGDNFSTCIKIGKGLYYHHLTNKNSKLNNDQLKNLQEFLEAPYFDNKVASSNWDYIKYIWNKNNTSNIINDEKMPDYSTLK